jgi:hypothetical protein
MPVKSRLPELLKERKIQNPYQLEKLTGLGRGTCRRAFIDPLWVPNPQVMEVICKTLGLQPGDFLYYEESCKGGEVFN